MALLACGSLRRGHQEPLELPGFARQLGATVKMVRCMQSNLHFSKWKYIYI